MQWQACVQCLLNFNAPINVKEKYDFECHSVSQKALYENVKMN